MPSKEAKKRVAQGTQKRVVQVVRVSAQGDRDDENFMSPDDQKAKGKQRCEQETDWKLVEVLEEIDVSGKLPLAKRKGLKQAVEMVESGLADIILVAYLDRLARSTRVQNEVQDRVEAAGGDVITDVGKLTNPTANGKFINGIFGLSAEHFVDYITEKSIAGIQLAIEKGHWPVALIPGLRKPVIGRNEKDEPIYGPVELDPETYLAVREAFEMRANGARIADVRAHLRSYGIERSHAGVNNLLQSRQALGELHYGGKLIARVPAIVEDLKVWERVQEKKGALRGRKPKSDRLLARLGVLQCGTCGARMSIGSQRQRGRMYAFYRCCDTSDCAKRMAIGAELTEDWVVEQLQEEISELRGRASTATGVAEAKAKAERSQGAYVKAQRILVDAEDEDEARSILAQKRQSRDADREALAALLDRQELANWVTGKDWDKMTLEERRKLIQDAIDSVKVAPGRGVERLSITWK